MFIQQAGLLRGMDRAFINGFLDIATKESYKKGDFIFQRGEKADYFFILIKGHIRLSLGIFGHVVHVVDHTGEAFGWSSLVGINAYSASAECIVPTKVLRIENEKFSKILEKHSESGLIFFKRLSKMLGDRLLQSYAILPGISQVEIPLSFGSGQVMEVFPM